MVSIFFFNPTYPRKWSNFTNIFQMGWNTNQYRYVYFTCTFLQLEQPKVTRCVLNAWKHATISPLQHGLYLVSCHAQDLKSTAFMWPLYEVSATSTTLRRDFLIHAAVIAMMPVKFHDSRTPHPPPAIHSRSHPPLTLGKWRDIWRQKTIPKQWKPWKSIA